MPNPPSPERARHWHYASRKGSYATNEKPGFMPPPGRKVEFDPPPKQPTLEEMKAASGPFDTPEWREHMRQTEELKRESAIVRAQRAEQEERRKVALANARDGMKGSSSSSAGRSSTKE